MIYGYLYLLLRKVLCNVVLIDDLSPLQFLLLNLLDALTLHVASTDQHTLEGSKAKIIVALR